MRKILSLLLAFSLVISPLGTFGNNSDIMPDLSGFEMPAPPNRASGVKSTRTLSAASELKEFNHDDIHGTPINGLPGEIEIPKKEISSPNKLKSSVAPAALPVSGAIGDKKSIYEMYLRNGTQISVTLSAIGTYCNIYVENNLSAANMAVNFLPTGSNPHSNAAAIAAEFDNVIYPLISNNFGNYNVMPNTSGKVNIVLTAVRYVSVSDEYIAGFFNGSDIFGGSISNKDTIIYVDIGQGRGYSNFSAGAGSVGRTSFYGTIAHEFQHLVNYSIYYDYGMRGVMNYFTTDPDIEHTPNGDAISVSTWYNEGLSGLADVLYLRAKGFSMNLDHLNYYLRNNFYAGSEGGGYMPTTAQWRKAQTGGDLILANYGASSVLIQHYMEYIGDAKPLLTPQPNQPLWVGYYSSMYNISTNFWSDSSSWTNYGQAFEAFYAYFILANLDIEVDSPYFYDSNIPCYYSDVVNNIWTHKSNYSIPVKTVSAGVSANFNTGYKNFISETYLASSVGAGKSKVKITIPTSPNAIYFVITPYNAANINSRAAWNTAPKMAGQLKPGVNDVTVGTNNMFAVLAIALDDAVNENFSYTINTSSNNWLISSVTSSRNAVRVNVSTTDVNGARLIAAFYDADGRLISVGDQFIKGSQAVDFTKPPGAARVKAFILSSFDKITPLCAMFPKNL